MNLKTIILIPVVLLAVLGVTQSISVVRFRSNLIVYDGYDTDQRRVVYSNSAREEWKDLASLLKRSALEQKALICGTGSGTWLAYPEKNFKMHSNAQSVWILVGETCIAGDNINSAQSVGSITAGFDGLVTFTEPYFQSDHNLVTNGSESASGVKSLISTGPGIAGEENPNNWTIEGDGKKYCLVRPPALTSLGVCVLPDIPTQLGMNGASIKIGCDDMDISVPQFQLDTCFLSQGAYRILDKYLTFPVMTQICSGAGDESQKLGFYKIYDAWKFRMNPERQEEINPANIDKNRRDDMNPTRMRLLNYFFAIFHESCPMLPGQYFNLVRYLYMQHIKSIWEEAPQVLKDRNDTKFDWRSAHDYLESCYNARSSAPVHTPGGVSGLDLCVKNAHPFLGPKPEEEGMALDLFLQGDNLDHIVEHVWLMLNLVSPFCASALGYFDNRWVEFVSLFRRQFLLPLLQQWVNPGPWQTYYEYMFNGFSLDDGKRRVITCVQRVISNTPSLDPIDRPSASAKEFTAVSKKRPVVKTDKDKAKEGSATGGKKKNRKRQTRSTSSIRQKKGRGEKKDHPNAQHVIVANKNNNDASTLSHKSRSSGSGRANKM